MDPLISAAELKLLKPGSYLLLDARGVADAPKQYAEGHLTGALFANMETQLSAIEKMPGKGGRHPLPDVKVFSRIMGEWGIIKDSHVIIYDDKGGGNAAARCWWMLKAAGHEKVQVLNGGLQAAMKEGMELVKGVEKSTPAKPYPFEKWLLPTVNIDQVNSLKDQGDKMVIDVRDAYRYNGESEPIDIIAGHIPGAVNIPFVSNLNKEGLFLSAGELKQKYNDALAGRNPKDVIVHCGSGVTACHTLLAMELAGIKGASLYVGSFSEWCNAGREIAVGSHP